MADEVRGRAWGTGAARLGPPLVATTILVVAAAVGVSLRVRRVPQSTLASVEPSVPAPSAFVFRAEGKSPLPIEWEPSPPPKSSAVPTRHGAMHHGDVRRTHRARGVLARDPKLAWTYVAKGPVVAQVATSPDESVLYVASWDGTLTALDAAGAVRWQAPLGDRLYAAPAVGDDGTLYVGSDAKRLVALTPLGKVKWRFDTDGEVDTPVALAPDGTVLVAAGRMAYAVNPRGEVVWRFRAKKKIYTAIALGEDQTAYFGAQDDSLYAVTRTGTQKWAVGLGGDVDGGPVVLDDGTVAVGTDAGEVVFVSREGAVVARTKVGGYVRGSLSVLRGGDVTAGVYGPSPRLVRVGVDGAIRGSIPIQGTGSKDYGVHGGAAEDDEGTLVFGGQDDAVHAITATGERLFRLPVEGDVDAPVTILSDGRFVVATDAGKVCLYRP